MVEKKKKILLTALVCVNDAKAWLPEQVIAPLKSIGCLPFQNRAAHNVEPRCDKMFMSNLWIFSNHLFISIFDGPVKSLTQDINDIDHIDDMKTGRYKYIL